MHPLLFHQRKKLKKKIAESNLNKQTQKSIMNYRQRVTYIPHKQGKIDEMTTKTSQVYYEALFKTALYIVKEEVAFRKFKSLVDLQRRNGVKAESTDKLKTKQYA